MFWHGDYRITGQKARVDDADVIVFILEGGSKVILRPSGTEPKIKFYILARGDKNRKDMSIDDARQSVDMFFENAKNEIFEKTSLVADSISGKGE